MNWSQRGIFLVTLAYIFTEPCLAADSNDLPSNLDDFTDVKPDPIAWWQTSVIYQIYPRSFKDSNGDGVGDINGIMEKADYLKSLGVGAVWISPFYTSPMADFGYDISNYRDVDPVFGTSGDYIFLTEVLKSRGIKILLDLVPNHTSDEHEWFQKSVQNIEPYRDYYVWRDAKMDANGTRIPPTNWISNFGGSAWTWNDARQQYYLHQFAAKQPDLNYSNPAVLQEMEDVMRFWLDRVVDGFRVDAVQTLVEDSQFLDEPRSFKEGVGPDEYDYLEHIYTFDQPGSFDIVSAFRAVIDEYDSRFMMVETYGTPNSTMRWYGNETVPGANLPFNTLLITDVNASSTARDFAAVIASWYEVLPAGDWANWVIGNHDNKRAAERFGRDMLDSLHIMQAILPGTMITYNGDEIAMVGGQVRWSETVDPAGLLAGELRYTAASRDPERLPFQWDSSVSAGFSTNRTTWLPCAPDYWRFNVQQQMKGKSHLSVYKSLVALKSLPVIQTGTMLVVAPTEDILVISRFLEPLSMFVAVINVGSFEVTFDLEGASQSLVPPNNTWRVYASSTNCKHQEGETVDISGIDLRPKAGLVLTNVELDEFPMAEVSNVDSNVAGPDELQSPDSAEAQPDEPSKDNSGGAHQVEFPNGAWVVAPGEPPKSSADVVQPAHPSNYDSYVVQPGDLSNDDPVNAQPDEPPSAGASIISQNCWSLLICHVLFLFFFMSQ